MPKFHLAAHISSASPSTIEASLRRFVGAKASIKKTDDGFEIAAELDGESARDLNRQLLSELRRAEKRTRLRAEWTSGKTVEKFFDYVPKGTRKT